MTIAIVLASGVGTRMGMNIPKALIKIKNKPLFIYPTTSFVNNKKINKTIVVCHPKHITSYKKELTKFKSCSNVICIEGDLKNRQGSLICAMNFIKKNFNLKQNDLILTHDCARIFIDNEITNKTLDVAKKYGFSTAAIKASDSLINVTNKSIKYISRDNVWQVQTPQVFQYKYWKKYQVSNSTDLFSYLKLKLGKKNLVEGSNKNIKITNKLDLNLFW